MSPFGTVAIPLQHQLDTRRVN